MTNGTKPIHTKTEATFIIAGLVAILAAIGFVGLRVRVFGIAVDQLSHTASWLTIMVLGAGFCILAGYGITGRWRGILIDHRRKMSLARLQLLGWTLLVLSAYFSAVLLNVGIEGASPADVMNVAIPSELWVVMGISTGSAVGASALMANRTGDADAAKALHKNTNPDKARWSDLLMGDWKDSKDTVDLGKLQMFLFSFILMLAYAAVIADQFSAGGFIKSLPPVEDGMNVLLGISHTGYLSKKAVFRSQSPSTSNKS